MQSCPRCGVPTQPSDLACPGCSEPLAPDPSSNGWRPARAAPKLGPGQSHQESWGQGTWGPTGQPPRFASPPQPGPAWQPQPGPAWPTQPGAGWQPQLGAVGPYPFAWYPP